MRAEDKNTVSGNDLTAKIAKAYHSVPPEQRARRDADANDIQNPELDRAFDKMVEMYRIRRPQRENSVVAFPAPPAASAASDMGALAKCECKECGYKILSGNQFCGMCGAAREDGRPIPGVQPQARGPHTSPGESGIRHHHHYYHHDHYRSNPYLLLAVVLLMGAIAWQQSREFRRREAPAIVAPAAMPRPQPPTQARPDPVVLDMSKVPVREPSVPSAAPPQVPTQARGNLLPRHGSTVPLLDRSVQPAKKPAPIPTGPLSVPPVQQLRSRVSAPQPSPVPPVALYQTLTLQPMPVFPQFYRGPAKPGSAK